jgi:hypothetical protein
MTVSVAGVSLFHRRDDELRNVIRGELLLQIRPRNERLIADKAANASGRLAR